MGKLNTTLACFGTKKTVVNSTQIPKYVLNLFQEGSEKDSEEDNQSNVQDEVRKSITTLTVSLACIAWNACYAGQ